VVPQNRAIARNDQCTRCVTVAQALQYIYTVDDPNDVPRNVRDLLSDMEKEIRDVGRHRNIGAGEADIRINAVIDRFKELAVSLNDQADLTEDTTSPDIAPTPSSSPDAVLSTTPGASPSPAQWSSKTE
jgi:hypothetical protein